ncbi:MAG: NusG domain II-containing protein [Anaerorhabdus sp.]
MKNKKRFEIIILSCIGFFIVLLYVFSFFIRENIDEEQIVSIIYDENVVETFNPDVNNEYWIEGSYGKLKVEVLDSKWRVTEEDCPNHICSNVGWVSISDYYPIVCLPNEVSVVIK